MRCEDISTKSIDYLTGAVSDAERLELDGHLKSCLACRAEFAEIAQIWTKLGEIPAFVPDSKVMRARFNAAGSAAHMRHASRDSLAHKRRERPHEAPRSSAQSEPRWRMAMRSVRNQARREALFGRLKTGPGRALAVSASVLVIAAALLMANRFERRPDELSRLRAKAVAAPSIPDARPAKIPAAEADATLAGTDSAERWLEDRPDDSAVVQVSAHLAIANLENRVAAMDDLLNLERLQHAQPSRLYALQLQRAQLIDSLAQVRYAQMLAEETP